VEAKAEPAVEAQAEPAVEAQAEPAVEAQAEPAVEAQAEPAVEAKAEPAVEAKADAEPTAKAKSERAAAAKRLVFSRKNWEQGCAPRRVFRCAIPVAESCSPAPRRISLRPGPPEYAVGETVPPGTLRGLG